VPAKQAGADDCRRRIISVIEYAERPGKAGKSMPIPGEA